MREKVYETRQKTRSGHEGSIIPSCRISLDWILSRVTPQRNRPSPGQVAQLEFCPVHQKSCGFDSGQGTYLGYRFDLGRVRQQISFCLCLWISLSSSLSQIKKHILRWGLKTSRSDYYKRILGVFGGRRALIKTGKWGDFWDAAKVPPLDLGDGYKNIHCITIHRSLISFFVVVFLCNKRLKMS